MNQRLEATVDLLVRRARIGFLGVGDPHHHYILEEEAIADKNNYLHATIKSKIDETRSQPSVTPMLFYISRFILCNN